MNIVIVGGGTAGWLTAYCLNKFKPNCFQITVIESSKLGIIGAGEGSTGLFLELLKGAFFNNSIDLNDFVEKCDATNKKGIKFVNWGTNPDFFSPLDGSQTNTLTNDFFFKYVLSEYGNQKTHLASNIGLDYDNKIAGAFTALHFDAHKVGNYFKNICEKDNVMHVDAVVNDVLLDQYGKIKELILDNNSQITADLFFDCSGFNRILMKKLGVKWISYKEHLPLDTAMPFLLPYEDGEKYDDVTTATAMSAGWMWDIPLRTRRGCGYVYDSRFRTAEEAKTEIEVFLGKEITPIKIINFDSGRNDVFWKSNVISVGLSSSFVEPLQATSIHNTIAQLIFFIEGFLQTDIDLTLNVSNIEEYNRLVSQLYDISADFISLHYQGSKSDSEFWKYVCKNKIGTPYALNCVERSKSKILENHVMRGNAFSPNAALWNWTIAGLDIISPEQAKKELEDSNLYELSKQQYTMFNNSYYRTNIRF